MLRKPLNKDSCAHQTVDGFCRVFKCTGGTRGQLVKLRIRRVDKKFLRYSCLIYLVNHRYLNIYIQGCVANITVKSSLLVLEGALRTSVRQGRFTETTLTGVDRILERTS